MSDTTVFATHLVEMWSVLQVLASTQKGLSVSEIAFRTGLPPRFVRDTIRTILSDGHQAIAIEEERNSGEKPVYYLVDETVARTILLSEEERKSLASLPHDGLSRFGAGWVPHLLLKGHGVLYPSLRVLRQVTSLERAIRGHFCVKIVKTSLRDRVGRKELIVEPLGLVASPSGWHLLARGRGGKHLKYQIPLDDRIKQVTVMHMSSFDYPQDFCLAEYMKNAWGLEINQEEHEVVIAFMKPGLRQRVEFETRHRQDRSFSDNQDGSFVYKDRVRGLDELARWVRSFGQDAHVLAPRELQKTLVRQARAVLKRYGRG